MSDPLPMFAPANRFIGGVEAYLGNLADTAGGVQAELGWRHAIDGRPGRTGSEVNNAVARGSHFVEVYSEVGIAGSSSGMSFVVAPGIRHRLLSIDRIDRHDEHGAILLGVKTAFTHQANEGRRNNGMVYGWSFSPQLSVDVEGNFNSWGGVQAGVALGPVLGFDGQVGVAGSLTLGAKFASGW